MSVQVSVGEQFKSIALHIAANFSYTIQWVVYKGTKPF